MKSDSIGKYRDRGLKRKDTTQPRDISPQESPGFHPLSVDVDRKTFGNKWVPKFLSMKAPSLSNMSTHSEAS